MRNLLTDIRNFINSDLIPQATLLFSTGYYDDYFSIGVGPGKLLSYGVFPQGTDSVNTRLLKRGIYDGTSVVPVMDQNNIVEDVLHSWYTNSDNLNPIDGVTSPVITPNNQYNTTTFAPIPGVFPEKPGAYSWLKAPRYKTDGVNKDVYEVGPLARMVVSGAYAANISAADRKAVRILIEEDLPGVNRREEDLIPDVDQKRIEAREDGHGEKGSIDQSPPGKSHAHIADTTSNMGVRKIASEVLNRF